MYRTNVDGPSLQATANVFRAMQNDWTYLTGKDPESEAIAGVTKRDRLPADTGCVCHQRQRYLKDEVCAMDDGERLYSKKETEKSHTRGCVAMVAS